MPVTAPADRRFRRAHLKPARKRAGFTSRRWRAAIVVIVIGLVAVRRTSRRCRCRGLEMFQVDQINVRGNHRLSNGEVLAMLQSLRGRSVLAVDLAEWRQALLNSPWVADASLRRTLPSTVDVVDSRARAARHRPHQRRRCIWSTIAARSSTSTGRITPISICRSSTACRSRVTRPRRSGTPTCIARCSRGGCSMRFACGTWRGRFRRSTSAIRGTPSCCSTAIRR